VAKTEPYFHDGSVSNLNDAIRIMAKTQLNKELSDTEVQKIEVFLNALTGEVPKAAL
jgi:cytochrome c peroxidase